jgi:hypothetical protein
MNEPMSSTFIVGHTLNMLQSHVKRFTEKLTALVESGESHMLYDEVFASEFAFEALACVKVYTVVMDRLKNGENAKEVLDSIEKDLKRLAKFGRQPASPLSALMQQYEVAAYARLAEELQITVDLLEKQRMA